MNLDENEQLRSNIWDQIYRDGPQTIGHLSEQMQMSIPAVFDLVDHAWFAVRDEQVDIAKVGE